MEEVEQEDKWSTDQKASRTHSIHNKERRENWTCCVGKRLLIVVDPLSVMVLELIRVRCSSFLSLSLSLRVSGLRFFRVDSEILLNNRERAAGSVVR